MAYQVFLSPDMHNLELYYTLPEVFYLLQREHGYRMVCYVTSDHSYYGTPYRSQKTELSIVALGPLLPCTPLTLLQGETSSVAYIFWNKRFLESSIK
jgi:hypothetical protein